MHCPKCGHSETKVYDSRLTNSGKATRRRRECEKCHYRFTTVEEMKFLDVKVEKRSGQIVDFDKVKLERGIRKAFNKRNVNRKHVDKLVQRVSEDVITSDKNPIKTTKIGRIVLKNLREIDEVAYICFGAMFLNFENYKDFDELIKKFDKA